MKKVAFVVLAMALLTLCFAAVPVMAKPTDGLKVAAGFGPGPETVENEGEYTVLNGNIVQIKGYELIYPQGWVYIGGMGVIPVYSYNLWQMEYNLKSLTVIVNSEVEWTSLADDENGWTGRFQWKLYNFIPGVETDSSYQIQGVMHGFGDYEGITIYINIDANHLNMYALIHQ